MELNKNSVEIGSPEFYKNLVAETNWNIIEICPFYEDKTETHEIKQIPKILTGHMIAVFEKANSEKDPAIQNKLTDLAFLYSEIVKSTVCKIYNIPYEEHALVRSAFDDIGRAIKTDESQEYDARAFNEIEGGFIRTDENIFGAVKDNQLYSCNVTDALRAHNMKVRIIFDRVLKYRNEQPEITKKIINELTEIAKTSLSLYQNEGTLNEMTKGIAS